MKLNAFTKVTLFLKEGNTLTILHTSVDVSGESVSTYQLCNQIAERCMCVCFYTVSPQGNRVFCSQVWVRMCCIAIHLAFSVIVFFTGQIPELIPLCCSS